MNRVYKTSHLSKVNSLPDKIVINKNLTLRRLFIGDAEALFQIIQEDPKIGQNVTWPAGVQSLEDTRRGIRQLFEGVDKSPYVLQENGITIGYVGTWGNEHNGREIGLSYFLAKSKRGHGFVTLAIKSLMNTAKDTLPLDTFVVNIIDGNEPSKAIAMKLGFKSTDKLQYDKVLKAFIRRYEKPL